MENNRKEKVINVGMTNELISFMEKWIEDYRKRNGKDEKPGLEVKRAIVALAVERT